MASTEPRSFERGDRARELPGVHHYPLQRSRALSSAEMLLGRTAARGANRFNGAALFRARRFHAGAVPDVASVSFNGAALFRARR